MKCHKRDSNSSHSLTPVKETSASLSMPSSWMLSLSDLEFPLDLFILRKYCPHLCLPASFFSLFSFALLFWNHTWKKIQMCLMYLQVPRQKMTRTSTLIQALLSHINCIHLIFLVSCVKMHLFYWHFYFREHQLQLKYHTYKQHIKKYNHWTIRFLLWKISF